MNLLRNILHPWTLLGALLVAIALGVAALTYLNRNAPQPLEVVQPTALVSTIPAPTDTPLVVTAPPISPTPTLAIPAAPPPGEITLGTLVQIAGTGGEGLNLRASPGLATTIEYLGLESEVFTVQEGPVEADGLTWWYIVGFYDTSRSGWAASNFLDVVQTP